MTAPQLTEKGFTANEIGDALNREVDLNLASIEEVARIRLALDDIQALIKKRRGEATKRLEAEAENGAFRAADREWYMQKPGHTDTLPVPETFAALKAGGVNNKMILAAMKFTPKGVKELCSVFDVDYDAIVVRKAKKAALGIKKV